MENPYFYVADMECWPCENVHSVIDLTGLNNYSLQQSGTPYIAQTRQKNVFFYDLQKLYKKNQSVFDNEANNVKSTNTSINNLKRLFQHNPQSSTHISWRINKMLPGRLLRELFPRPYIISEWSGQSIERYIMIDGEEAQPYTLPNTECSYIFILQGSGERTIILKPSKECGDVCRTVSAVLKPSYVCQYSFFFSFSTK